MLNSSAVIQLQDFDISSFDKSVELNYLIEYVIKSNLNEICSSIIGHQNKILYKLKTVENVDMDFMYTTNPLSDEDESLLRNVNNFINKFLCEKVDEYLVSGLSNTHCLNVDCFVMLGSNVFLNVSLLRV